MNLYEAQDARDESDREARAMWSLLYDDCDCDGGCSRCEDDDDTGQYCQCGLQPYGDGPDHRKYTDDCPECEQRYLDNMELDHYRRLDRLGVEY